MLDEISVNAGQQSLMEENLKPEAETEDIRTGGVPRCSKPKKKGL